MALTNGPTLGLLVNGNAGEGHYNDLMKQWRGLDALVMPAMKGVGTNAPPGSPADGDAYVVGTSPTGAWAAKNNQIARWSSVANAWEFYVPKAGWQTRDASTANISIWHFNGTSWSPNISSEASLAGRNVSILVKNAANANATTAQIIAINDADRNLRIQKASSGHTSPLLGGAPGGEAAAIFTDSAHPLYLGTNATLRMLIDGSSGVVTIPGGINLGQTDLKNYQEGTWTPTIYGRTTAGTPTYVARSGKYTRVGNLVLVAFDIQISAKGGMSGAIAVGGLPFAMTSDNAGGGGQINYQSGNSAGISSLLRFNSATAFYLVSNTAGGTTVDITDANIADATRLVGSAMFFI